MKISALIHTRDEEANLPACLRSVAWADEVVVADMASKDRTKEIAIAAGARVVEVPIADCVEKVRNMAIAACTGDWVLVVDADEAVPEKLVERLKQLSTTTTAAAFGIPRKNYFLGVWLEYGVWPDHQIRFLRQGKVRWTDLVHEHPQVDGELVYLPADPEIAFEHYGYAPNLQYYLNKVARYAPLDAQRVAATNRPPVWPYLIRRPVGEFCGRYFVCGAWRHGMVGLVWSLVAANYQLQVCLHYWAANRNTIQLEPAALRRQIRWEIWREALKWLRN